MSKVKVIGYVRVSQVGAREGDSFISPQLQREQIASVAAREGLTVVRVIEELDASGGDSKRPGWNEAIEAVERGEVKGIAVWNLSRFSRSLPDALRALARIEDAGGRVYSATEDTGNKMVRNILLTIAEAERDRAAEGFRAAQLSAVQRGIHVAGRVPLGYRRRTGKELPAEERRLQIDPDTAPIVQGAFERKAKGVSHEALARWVQEHGVEGFSSTGVRWMLSNRAYLGEARAAGAVTEGAHPAIVSKSLFAKCQERGVQSARTGVLAGRFLLQGVARCAGCGRGLYLSTSGKGRAFYRCRTTVCEARGYAGAEALDAHVLNVLDERLNPADPAGWVAAPGGDDAEVAEAELALAEARADLDGFLEDTTLRRTLGADRYNAAVADYVAVADKAEADLERARAASSASFDLVGRLWNTEWGHAERAEWLARTVAQVAVSKGREPLSRRVEVELR